MAAKVGKENFEKNLKRLEEIVSCIEGGEGDLEEILKLFEEGIGIARKCQKFLEEAEAKINRLAELDESGTADEFPGQD
ncbi:MAG: exodeoxyribonuclease VII small subunit [bacterium]